MPVPSEPDIKPERPERRPIVTPAIRAYRLELLRERWARYNRARWERKRPPLSYEDYLRFIGLIRK